MPIRLMNQFAIDFRTDRHFDKIVVHITYDPGCRSQFNSLMRKYVTTNYAVEYNIRHCDTAFPTATMPPTAPISNAP